MIVTLDSDFYRLLAISGASAPSVMRIRREGLRGPDVAALIRQAANAAPPAELSQGAGTRSPTDWH